MTGKKVTQLFGKTECLEKRIDTADQPAMIKLLMLYHY